MRASNLLKLVFIVFLTGFISNALASAIPDYTCPESSEVKNAILRAAQQNLSEVKIPTRFGLLQAELPGTIDIGDLDNLAFHYASFLFGDSKSATYEVSCAYKEPNIAFYTYSKSDNYTIYMGLSPNWYPDENQLYATCTYSARYCVFKEKKI